MCAPGQRSRCRLTSRSIAQTRARGRRVHAFAHTRRTLARRFNSERLSAKDGSRKSPRGPVLPRMHSCWTLPIETGLAPVPDFRLQLYLKNGSPDSRKLPDAATAVSKLVQIASNLEQKPMVRLFDACRVGTQRLCFGSWSSCKDHTMCPFGLIVPVRHPCSGFAGAEISPTQPLQRNVHEIMRPAVRSDGPPAHDGRERPCAEICMAYGRRTY